MPPLVIAAIEAYTYNTPLALASSQCSSSGSTNRIEYIKAQSLVKSIILLACMVVLFGPLEGIEARGGGSKRTFGSPKSQSSQNQNIGELVVLLHT